MPRPKTFDPADAYDLLLQLFWRDGLSAMSVNRMADHLGMTRSSFYNAFGSRDALLKNLIIYYELQSPQIAFVLAYRPIDVKFLMTSVIRELCDRHRQDTDRKGCLLTNLSIELRENEPELKALLKKINADRVARLVELCGWAIEAKDLPRQANGHQFGLQLFALIEQINLLARSLPEIETLEALALTQLAKLGLRADI